MIGDEIKVQRHYDEMAEVYDRRYDYRRGRCYHAHISQHVMNGLVQGGFLLDIGCGTGLFVNRYTENGGTAVGLDISSGMIEKAVERCPDSDFTVGDGDVLPFRDSTFDAVASLLAFSYLKDPGRMLSEAYRVLKPGGTISVCTLGKNLLTAGLPAIHHIGEAMKIQQVGMGDFGEHYYNEKEMRNLFSEAGFTGVQVKRCSFAHLNLVEPVFDIAKKIEPFVERRLPCFAYNICVKGKKE
jgi:ubiquinone/menaquinone biosynthesis C-methylase UbiE